jgi:uncharacterized protein
VDQKIDGKMEFRDFTVAELRAAKDQRTIEGYASVFNVVDSYQSMFVKGAFTDTIRERGDRVRFLRGHMWDDILGRITDLSEDDKGLHFKASVSDTTLGNDTLTLVRDGALDEVSIGFRTIAQRYDPDNDILVKQQVELWEVSLVTFAANSLARVEAIRSHYATLSEQLKDAAIVDLRATDETKEESLEEKTKEPNTDTGDEIRDDGDTIEESVVVARPSLAVLRRRVLVQEAEHNIALLKYKGL